MGRVKMIKYSTTYFLGYVVFSMGMSQYVPYLSSLGYTTSRRGIMISAYALTTILFQLLLGFLTDRYQRVKDIFMISLLLFAISTMFLFAIDSQIFMLHIVLVALSGGLMNANAGVMDNWLFSNGKKEVENFSFIRAFGSAGWAISCMVGASLISAFGYKNYGVGALVLAIIVCILVQLSTKQRRVVKHEKSPIKMSDIKQLISNKKYITLTIVLLLLFCATTTSGSVVVDKMLLLGADNQDIGLKWAICGGVEIPIYFIGAHILRRLGSYKLLIISAVLIALQYTLFMLSSHVSTILLISAMQMFTGPLVMLSSRKLYYDMAPEKLRATSLLVALSVYQGISMLVIPIVCGFISENIGVDVSLGFVSFLATIGIVFAFRLLRLHQKETMQTN